MDHQIQLAPNYQEFYDIIITESTDKQPPKYQLVGIVYTTKTIQLYKDLPDQNPGYSSNKRISHEETIIIPCFIYGLTKEQTINKFMKLIDTHENTLAEETRKTNELTEQLIEKDKIIQARQHNYQTNIDALNKTIIQLENSLKTANTNTLTCQDQLAKFKEYHGQTDYDSILTGAMTTPERKLDL